MKISFSAKGHENILGTHKTTLEFTKDTNLTLNGDCIIGVEADFDLKEIKKLLKYKKAVLEIKVDGQSEKVTFDINPNFNSDHEIVIRKGEFLSERTLGIRADKSSVEVSRQLI